MKQWFPYDGNSYEDDTSRKARRALASYCLAKENDPLDHETHEILAGEAWVSLVLRNWFYRYEGD